MRLQRIPHCNASRFKIIFNSPPKEISFSKPFRLPEPRAARFSLPEDVLASRRLPQVAGQKLVFVAFKTNRRGSIRAVQGVTQ